MTQYDFLALRITEQDNVIQLSQGDSTIEITPHQLPDLIRTLNRIHAETQAAYAKEMLGLMREDLKAPTGGKADLRPVNGQGPEGVA